MSTKSVPDVVDLAILAAVADKPQHGYALVANLNGYGGVATGGLYRKLRNLGDRGFLDCYWDTPHAGPARRVWLINDEGRAHLAEQRPALEEYGIFVRSTLRGIRAAT
jgi:DNA-binding PadR family transcriptional regulator